MGKKMFMKTFGSSGYASSLILYQTFKNTVADLTGLNVPTTAFTSYVNGLYSGLPNESILFDSTSDKVIIPNNARFSFVSKASFSIVVALNLTSVSGNKWILQKRDSGSVSTAEYQIYISSGVLYIVLFDASTSGYIAYNLGSVAVGVNYVIAISYDSVNEIVCKINNVARVVTKATTGTFTSMRVTSSYVSLFFNFWSPSISGAGTVDTLSMFNKNLTSAEFTDIYTKITTNQSLI